MNKKTSLVIMAKQPRKGFTKTRLCPPLTPQQAAALSEAMLLDTLALGNHLPDIQLAIAITPIESLDYFKGKAVASTILVPITGADIGECLAKATATLFAAGFQKVIAMNADSPTLLPEDIRLANHLLNENDVVLGPGEDGGYYLIGLNQPCPEIFQEITWSTPHVLSQTIARGEILGLRIALTPPWYDVDTFKDVLRLFGELDTLPKGRLRHTRQFFSQFPISEWYTK